MVGRVLILAGAVTIWFGGIQLLLCVSAPGEEPRLAEESKEDCIPTRDAAALKDRENRLRAVAEKLLRAFRTGDTESFLDLVHPDYFTVGESRNYTIAELKESFRTKKEMYCYLFDATCIPPPEGNDTRETSFREMAKRPEARVESIEVSSEAGIVKPGCTGTANLAWVAPLDPSHVSTFTFMYVGGEWKTVGFDFPPAVPHSGHKHPKSVGP